MDDEDMLPLSWFHDDQDERADSNGDGDEELLDTDFEVYSIHSSAGTLAPPERRNGQEEPDEDDYDIFHLERASSFGLMGGERGDMSDFDMELLEEVGDFSVQMCGEAVGDEPHSSQQPLDEVLSFDEDEDEDEDEDDLLPETPSPTLPSSPLYSLEFEEGLVADALEDDSPPKQPLQTPRQRGSPSAEEAFNPKSSNLSRRLPHGSDSPTPSSTPFAPSPHPSATPIVLTPHSPSPISDTARPERSTSVLRALPSLPPPPVAPSRARKEPTAEEMQQELDAWFKFVPPPAPPATILPPPPSPVTEVEEPVRSDQEMRLTQQEDESQPRLTREEKGKGVEVRDEDELEDTQPSATQAGTIPKQLVYQLSPIPKFSPSTGLPITPDEKRLLIIESLERITSTIIAQLADIATPLPTEADETPAAPPSNPNDEDTNPSSQPSSKGNKGRKKQPKKTNESKTIVVLLANRGKKSDLTQELDLDAVIPKRRLVFPRKNGNGCGGKEMAVFLKTVELILDGLRKNVVATKRDLFYRCVKLFTKQATVDAVVEDIAATLQVRRSDLNVVAASKGLFGGHVKILGVDGVVLEGGDQGALIPPMQCIKSVTYDDCQWVLIIEKEAVFHTLCTTSFLDKIPDLPHGILLTGKGYPDVSTREFAQRISLDLPKIPILCLVDSDPHGLSILSTYKFGSQSLSFDRASLVVPKIEWMGVKFREWDELGIDRDELLNLTKKDRKMALAFMKREWWPEEWRRELQYMLHLGYKAEIQVLASVERKKKIAVVSNSERISSTEEENDVTMENVQPQGEGLVTLSTLFYYVSEKIIGRLKEDAGMEEEDAEN